MGLAETGLVVGVTTAEVDSRPVLVATRVDFSVLRECGTLIDLVGRMMVVLRAPVPVPVLASDAVPVPCRRVKLAGRVAVKVGMMVVCTCGCPSEIWMTGTSVDFPSLVDLAETYFEIGVVWGLAAAEEEGVETGFDDDLTGFVFTMPNWVEYWNWPVPVTMIWRP